MKLGLDQEELLRTLLENKEELRVLYLVIEDVVSGYESSVNKVMLSDQASERDLLYKRLRADGARKLLLDIGRVLKIK